MGVITRTVNTLIEEAYKLIGIFSEDNALQESKTVEALGYLQEILDNFAANDKRIAYNNTLTFNLVIGQQTYSFSKKVGADVSSNRIVNLKYVTLKDGDFSYPIQIETDEIFFNRRRALDRQRRPSLVFFQNDIEESRITFFVKPDKTYECTIKGKFALDPVALSQPLNEVPAYYHRFLKYAVGRELNNHFPGSIWTANHENTYQTLLENIINASDISLDSRSGVALKSYRTGYSLEEFLNGY